MKKLVYSLIAAVSLIALPVTQVGCKNPDRTAYNIVSVSHTTVDAAMKAWGSYVAQFHPGPATEAKVKRAYETYQEANAAAADAGAAYARAKASGTGETEARAAFDTAIAVASSALSNLTSVLAQFGINLQP